MTSRHIFRTLLSFIVLCLVSSWTASQAIILVYDLKVDFATSNNVTSDWKFYEGSTLLTHFTPVPTSLAAAVSGGYWGTSSTSLNTSIMQATANGSTVAGYNDNDFLSGDMLLRTTDPNTGGPLTITWTAPTAGSFTYSGEVWYADPPTGPFGNSFTLTLNNGPPMESGSAIFGQNRPNGYSMLNGLIVTNVLAGDVVALQLIPSVLPPAPSGSLAGVNFVIDFLPAPEPSTGLLTVLGSLSVLAGGRRALRRKSAP